MLWRTKSLCWSCSAFPSQTWDRKQKHKGTKAAAEVQRQFHYNHMWLCKIFPFSSSIKIPTLNRDKKLFKKENFSLSWICLFFFFYFIFKLLTCDWYYLSLPAKSWKCLASQPGKTGRLQKKKKKKSSTPALWIPSFWF